MPTYGYQCTQCSHEFQAFQAMKDDPITECPVCGGVVKRLLYPVGIVFKGSGWYINDLRAEQASAAGRAAAAEQAKDSKDGKDGKDSRDGKDGKDSKESKDRKDGDSTSAPADGKPAAEPSNASTEKSEAKASA